MTVDTTIIVFTIWHAYFLLETGKRFWDLRVVDFSRSLMLALGPPLMLLLAQWFLSMGESP